MNETPDLSPLHRFLGTLSNKNPSLFLRAFSRILVSRGRHAPKYIIPEEKEWLSKSQSILRQWSKTRGLKEMLERSVVSRGIPMSPLIPPNRVLDSVEQAFSDIKNIDPKDKIQALLKDELLVTTLYTLYKTKLKLGASRNVLLEILEKCTKLDPHDSAPFTELGFFYAQDKKWEMAKNAFYQAAQNGSPGLALNLYYLAYCSAECGVSLQEIEERLLLSMEVDPLAISTVLDLANLYQKMGSKEKYRLLRERIYTTPGLTSQLTQEDREALHG